MEHKEIDMIAHSKRGVITLCLSPSTGANITGSLLVAGRIAKELKRGKVLYLNTVHTRRQLAGEIRKYISEDHSTIKPDPRISYMSCVAGTLNSLDGDIRTHLAGGVRFIIINSLEFSSKDYRRREDLFYQCRQWADEFDASVIVFSQRVKATAEQGTIQRGGGVGKFAGVAAAINYLSVKKNVEDEDMDDEQTGETEVRAEQKKKHRLSTDYLVIAAYQNSHPGFKAEEGEDMDDYFDRVIALATAEGLVGEDRKLKEEFHHMSVYGYKPDKPPVQSENGLKLVGVRELLR